MKSDQTYNHIFTGLIRFDHFFTFCCWYIFLYFGYILQKKTFLTAAFIGPRLVSEQPFGQGTGEARKELLDSFVFVMFYYVRTLFCKRASSMSKFTSPPEIYSKILSSDEEEAEMTLANILSDWRTLLLLEQSKYQELASDLNLTVSKPVRLAFTFFDAGKTDAAIGIMKSMLLVVPDTKLIEDIHQKVRVDSGANAKLNQSCAETQNIRRNSGLLEARGIPHTAQINRVTFLARWKTTPGNKKFKQVFHASSYKLAREFGSILAPRVWLSLSEEALARSSAGWTWIRKHMNLKAAGILPTESEFDKI